jgi:hypothetical protein
MARPDPNGIYRVMVTLSYRLCSCSSLITFAALLDYITIFSLNYLRIENPFC